MRTTSLFWKSMIENFRDWKLMIMTLTFGPFFVILIYFYSWETAQTAHRVIVVNHDLGAPTADQGILEAGEGLVREMMAVRDPDGVRVLEVLRETDMDAARRGLISSTAEWVRSSLRQLTRARRPDAAGHGPRRLSPAHRLRAAAAGGALSAPPRPPVSAS